MHPHRTKIGPNIIAEFMVPRRKSRRTVILCDGMPSVPSRGRLLKFLANRGIWGVHIRYTGTWESGGEFLARSPHLDVIDAVNQLPKGLKAVWDRRLYYPPTDKIYVVGSSFGGAAALLSSADPRVTGSFALSPVVDWQETGRAEPVELVYHLVREGFGQAYRCDRRRFNKLLTGKFYNPIHEAERLNGEKIHIVHCADDDITPLFATKRFVKKNGGTLIEYKRGGHMSLSKIMTLRIWKRFNKFIQSV